MKKEKFAVLTALFVAVVATAPVFAGCPGGTCGRNNNSNNVQGRYGVYNDYTSRRLTQVGEITEPMLLNQLDRQGRRQYFSLSDEGRALVLKMANEDRTRNKNEIVEMAVQQISNQDYQTSQRMLQNGMKR